MIFRFFIFFSALILSAAHLMAQPSSDSLKLEHFQEAVKKNPSDKAAIKGLGFQYMALNRFDESLVCGLKLIQMAEKDNDRDYAELYGRIIVGASLVETDSKRSLSNLLRAEAIAQLNNNHDALLSIYNSLGSYYLYHSNDTYLAIDYLQKALGEARHLGDKRRYAIISTNIASAYLNRNDTSGIQVAREALQLAENNNEALPIAYAKQVLLHFYVLADSLAEAETLIPELEESFRNEGYSGLDELEIMKGKIKISKGDFSAADRSYRMVLETPARYQPTTVLSVIRDYAHTLAERKMFGAAANVLRRALQFADTTEVVYSTPDIYKKMAEYSLQEGNYRDAALYSLQSQNLSDSLYRIDRERMLYESRIKNSVYLRELQLSDQKKELEVNKRKTAWLIGVIVTLAVAAALLVWSNRRRSRLYKAIVHQNLAAVEREHSLSRQIKLLLQEQENEEEESSEKEDTSETGKGTSQGGNAALPEAAPEVCDVKIYRLASRFTALLEEEKAYRDPALSVASVAERLDTNRTYLSRAVNETMGKTFTQVLNDYRIREAVEILSDPDDDTPLKQLASAVGFNSISTFYSIFQAATGLTPAAYRRQAWSVTERGASQELTQE